MAVIMIARWSSVLEVGVMVLTIHLELELVDRLHIKSTSNVL